MKKRNLFDHNISYDAFRRASYLLEQITELIGLKVSGDGSLGYTNLNGSTNISNQINITDYLPLDNVTENIINSITVIACMLGFMGNAMVIRLLGFLIKRNPFTTYILNLAIADFGVLFSLLSSAALGIALDVYKMFYISFILFVELFFFTYSTGQFLLAAISMDRCVAVLFPLWHRCHRPPHLSTIVCALIWIFSFLLAAIHFTLFMNESFRKSLLQYMFVLNAFFCTPLMVISAPTLFLKVFCKTQQNHRGKLATVIVLTLLFFLVFAFPLNALYIIIYYYGLHPRLMIFGFMCASLNSSINPVIYFLVGKRQKKGQTRVSMKAALQRVFKDEEDSMEEPKSSTESQLL
ncbi:proto-oncogene Mas-like [Hemicordylus capensis]|uniref:proto-oncogene Mas-like n=1 Tax=Hemicordylus capensis TaxID=884348 RepID=UPI0023039FE7|nr:proto-oncogene Mas-like [Hemicordylus capensis]